MNDKNADTKTSDKAYVTLEHSFFDEFKKEEITISRRFSKPAPKQGERAQKEMMKSPSRALTNLTMNVIHPEDKEEYKQNLKEYPGLASTFGGALLKAIGFGDLGN